MLGGVFIVGVLLQNIGQSQEFILRAKGDNKNLALNTLRGELSEESLLLFHRPDSSDNTNSRFKRREERDLERDLETSMSRDVVDESTDLESSGEGDDDLGMLFPTMSVKEKDDGVGNVPVGDNITATKSTHNPVTEDAAVTKSTSVAVQRDTTAVAGGLLSTIQGQIGDGDSANDLSEETDEQDTSENSENEEALSGRATKAESHWVGILLAALTSGVVFFFIGFFINRQCRKSKYGKQYVPVTNHMDTNGKEMQRFSVVDNDIIDDVSVPLNLDIGVNQDQTTSFKQDTPDSKHSPIDIVTSEAQEDAGLLEKPLHFDYSLVPQEHEIINIGNKIKIVADNLESYVTGGPLGDARYSLDHCTIQWEAVENNGSGHTVDGRSHAAEIHFVHWNKDAKVSFQEACSTPEGIAIVVVLVQLADDSGRQLTPICNNLRSVTHRSQSCKIPFFLISSLLPALTRSYWTYPGAMVTPPYTETITWIVLQQPIAVTKTQMKEFGCLKRFESDEDQSLENEDDKYCHQTYPVGTRVVRTVPKEV